MLIRKKILLGTLLLTSTLLLLMYCSLSGVYAYRHLTRMVEQLAMELQTTSDLRIQLDKMLQLSSRSAYFLNDVPPVQRSEFRNQVHAVDLQLGDYEQQLRLYSESDHFLADRSQELACVKEMRNRLDGIKMLCKPDNTDFSRASSSWVQNDIQLMVEQVQQLPTFVLERMRLFRTEVRSRYRALIVIIAASSLFALTIIVALFGFFRRSVVSPFKELLAGGRRIARGDFAHRVKVESKDELAELADALNKMTGSFVEVRDNLNDKVKERTQEVVRSEQLASVGFLAAGVAHEINNPLASIAWSAEALESRLHEVLHPTENADASRFDSQQIEILRKYLARIQDEAFRCKGITERLLDFSRLGESQAKQPTDVNESVEDVIELVKHLGQYRNKRIQFHGAVGLIAEVSPTELKQVALNLLTNSLDASDDGDVVVVTLQRVDDQMQLTVKDSGCGMTEEVKQHLFEPFFTRRRDGRGTGLGMSISYRIVQDHGGTLTPFSEGPGLGTTITLKIPLKLSQNENYEGSYDGLKAAA
ncbi:MAG: ATP-binding protein [Aureliella sp.]